MDKYFPLPVDTKHVLQVTSYNKLNYLSKEQCEKATFGALLAQFKQATKTVDLIRRYGALSRALMKYLVD